MHWYRLCLDKFFISRFSFPDDALLHQDAAKPEQKYSQLSDNNCGGCGGKDAHSG